MKGSGLHLHPSTEVEQRMLFFVAVGSLCSQSGAFVITKYTIIYFYLFYMSCCEECIWALRLVLG